MLLSMALATIGFAQGASNTKILVSPTVSTGNPGETLWIDIVIEAVDDLYGWQVELSYKAGTRNVGAIAVEEGDFLWGPDGTAMAYSVDPISGVVNVGQTILGDWPGNSGGGVLCRIQFAVTEAGESDLILENTVLLDSNLYEISHQTRDGFFDGVNVELVMINIGARDKHVGDIAEFEVKVQNEDSHSAVLNAKARVDVTRMEDGRTTSLWTGQTYEYPPVRDPIDLWVDGYTAERQQWGETGVSPFLDAADDGNEIYGISSGDQHRWFTFEDFTLGDAIIDYVELYVYCEGPYSEAIDYDIYAPGFNWLGSWYGTGAGRIWQNEPRWVASPIASDNYPDLLTEAGINDMEILIYNYGGAGSGDIIDAAYLHVVFASGRAPEVPVVDGYTAERQQWTEVGVSPFLDAADDGNHIVGTANGQQHRWFTFEDIELGTSVVDEVRLWVYCGGPFNEGIDYDVYAPGFNWLGSYYGTGAGMVWQDQPRWIDGIASDNYPDLLTEDGINGMEVLVYFYDPSALNDGTDVVDAMYLEITFLADRVALPLAEPMWEIQPGEVTWLEPLVWPMELEDIGTYTCTITVYYSFGGRRFNPGEPPWLTRSGCGSTVAVHSTKALTTTFMLLALTG
jgi:hypothetical protein